MVEQEEDLVFLRVLHVFVSVQGFSLVDFFNANDLWHFGGCVIAAWDFYWGS